MPETNRGQSRSSEAELRSGAERRPPLVSVVIAAFNAQDFIGRAIASVQAQDDVDLEILVVDDSSSDGTARLVDNLSRSDARIRLIPLPRNGGPSAARNAGLDAASGEWVAVLDADDAYLAGRLRHLLALAKETGADIVADNFYLFDRHQGSWPDPAVSGSPSVEKLDRYSFVDRARPFAPEMDLGLLKPMFRMAFLNDRSLRYDVTIRHGEDFDIIFHALMSGALYVLSRQPFYLYTTRTSGFSRTLVDYPALAGRTLELCALPAVRNDRRLVRLLGRRARALARLHVEREARRLRDQRRPFRLAAFLLPRIEGWKWLARSAKRKLSG